MDKSIPFEVKMASDYSILKVTEEVGMDYEDEIAE